MSIERNLVISALKLTKYGVVLIEDVNKDAHIPATLAYSLLQKLQNEGIIYLENDSIEADSNNRLKLAVKAVSLGADIEHISNLLCWQEFEEITAFALKNNGYAVHKNVRFTHQGHRWEIDVVGCKKPLVVCIDCKHWGHALSPSELKKIVEAQVQRTEALAESLPSPKLNFDCSTWDKAKFVPVVLCLIPCAYKFYYQVPIVPVLQLQNFLAQLPAYTQELKVFYRAFSKLGHDFEN